MIPARNPKATSPSGTDGCTNITFHHASRGLVALERAVWIVRLAASGALLVGVQEVPDKVAQAGFHDSAVPRFVHPTVELALDGHSQVMCPCEHHDRPGEPSNAMLKEDCAIVQVSEQELVKLGGAEMIYKRIPRLVRAEALDNAKHGFG